MIGTLMIASVVSLSAISYDRLTAIVLPKETRLNKKGTKILIIIGWIVAVLLSAPLSLIRNYKERQWKNFCEMSCTEKIVIANVYWYVVIAVLVWLPLTIQLICYIAIFVELTKYEKVVLRKLNLHQVSYKKKAVRMMFIVVITFMICRLPFTALIIYRHRLIEKNNIEPSHVVVQIQIDGFYYALWFISKYLIYVNAALNPLIYGVTNEKFRRGFKTTKLANWLFSPQRFTPVVIKTKDKEKKTSETVLRLNNNIFFIFRKQNKHKHIESSATPLSSGLFSPLDKCKF